MKHNLPLPSPPCIHSAEFEPELKARIKMVVDYSLKVEAIR